MKDPEQNLRVPERVAAFRAGVLGRLAEAGARCVIAGVSGGADSLALLDALASSPDVRLLALHCNFHLRGAESDRDMRHVISFCDRAGVELKVIHFDVEADRREHGGSVEMSCRRLRYDAFRELKELTGADRIVVAHNADDQAETLLLNLMRGCGVAGLRAMRPDTGEILRPLLDVSRREIEEYLALRGIPYVTDSTNLDSAYRRNFIRNEVLPLLATRWPDVRASLCRTASIMAQEERVLSRAERSLSPASDPRLPLRAVDEAPDPLWLVRRFVIRFGGNEKTAAEIARALARRPLRPGKLWKAGAGVICLGRDGLEFVDLSAPVEISVRATPHALTPELAREIHASPLSQLWTPLPPERLVFRSPREGDRIAPLGMTGTAAVSKILKDAGCSFAARRRAVVAEDAATGELVWVAGLKRARVALVGPGHTLVYRYEISTAPADKF